MAIRLFNTLGKKKETLEPIVAGHIGMYVCGPTVYGLTHIGNARPAFFFHVVRNYLEHSGFQVQYVSNFTDVDDKIINRAREEGMDSKALADRYVIEFQKDMQSLGVRPPDQAPRVTEYIPQIVRFIEGLISAEKAYATPDGDVFYAVRKFDSYGKLSGKNLDDLMAGARVDPNEKKRDPLDFSLWKPQKAKDEPAWESPWGLGRPGWHIECSVMSSSLLGESFDIHGGGMDLTHPHHENEIAQSEGLSGKPYVKYWMHNNMITMGSEKMSKSLGNIFCTRDFIQKYSAETLRFLLLSGHYRSLVDFSEKHIREVECALHRVYTCVKKCDSLRTCDVVSSSGNGTAEEQAALKMGQEFSEQWHSAMDDDFNTAKVIGQVFEYVRLMNACLDRKKFKFTESTQQAVQLFRDNLTALSKVINVFGEKAESFLSNLRARHLLARGITEADILAQIKSRTECRLQKDFQKADDIRNALLEKGIVLLDGPNGTVWDVEV